MIGPPNQNPAPKRPSDFIIENVLQMFRGRLTKLEQCKQKFEQENKQVKTNEMWLLANLPKQNDINEHIKNKMIVNWKCLCRSVNLQSYPFTQLIGKIKDIQPIIDQFSDVKTNLNTTHLKKLQELIRPYVKELIEGPTDVIAYQYYLKEFYQDKMNLLNNPTQEQMKADYFGKMLRNGRELSNEIKKQRDIQATLIMSQIRQFTKGVDTQANSTKV